MSIFVPRHLDEQPVYFCALCPKAFYVDEKHAYERHVLSHPLEEVQSHTLSHQAPGLFGDKGGDEEWGAWIDRHRAVDPQGLEAHKWMRTDDGKHSSGVGDG